MEYEYQLALDTISKTDYALTDGSLLARFYDRRQRKPVAFHEYARDLMG
jgi:hypothetical protein